jgi:hypothetical protein
LNKYEGYVILGIGEINSKIVLDLLLMERRMR